MTNFVRTSSLSLLALLSSMGIAQAKHSVPTESSPAVLDQTPTDQAKQPSKRSVPERVKVAINARAVAPRSKVATDKAAPSAGASLWFEEGLEDIEPVVVTKSASETFEVAPSLGNARLPRLSRRAQRPSGACDDTCRTDRRINMQTLTILP